MKKATQIENTLLWEIRIGDSLTSYLFGTMHMICRDKFELNPKLLGAIQNTDNIYFEVDITNPLLEQNIYQKNFSKTSLNKALTDKDYQYLSQVLKDYFNTDISQFENFHPSFIYGMMMKPQLDCELPISVEQLILEKVTTQNIFGLETMNYQMDLFQNLITYENLIGYIKDLNISDFQLLKNFYEDQDLLGMEELILKMYTPHPELIQKLLIERNENWLELISAKLRNESSFYAVGAAHLPTHIGLIELLRKNQILVTPLF